MSEEQRILQALKSLETSHYDDDGDDSEAIFDVDKLKPGKPLKFSFEGEPMTLELMNGHYNGRVGYEEAYCVIKIPEISSKAWAFKYHYSSWDDFSYARFDEIIEVEPKDKTIIEWKSARTVEKNNAASKAKKVTSDVILDEALIVEFLKLIEENYFKEAKSTSTGELFIYHLQAGKTFKIMDRVVPVELLDVSLNAPDGSNDMFAVFKVPAISEKFWAFNGVFDSWADSSWYLLDIYEVVPMEKTKIVWEKVSKED